MTNLNCLVLTVNLLKNLTFGCKTNILLFSTGYDGRTLQNQFIFRSLHHFSEMKAFQYKYQVLNSNRRCKLFFMTNLNCLVLNIILLKKTPFWLQNYFFLYLFGVDKKKPFRISLFCLHCKISVEINVFQLTDQVQNRNRRCNADFHDILTLTCFELGFPHKNSFLAAKLKFNCFQLVFMEKSLRISLVFQFAARFQQK